MCSNLKIVSVNVLSLNVSFSCKILIPRCWNLIFPFQKLISNSFFPIHFFKFIFFQFISTQHPDSRLIANFVLSDFVTTRRNSQKRASEKEALILSTNSISFHITSFSSPFPFLSFTLSLPINSTLFVREN